MYHFYMLETWMDRARARMEAEGLSQEMLAQDLNQTRGAIGHYLNGRRTPSLLQFEIIAESLGVHPAWLLYGRNVTEIREDAATYTTKRRKISKIPIIGTSASGPTDFIESYINLAMPRPNYYALTIIGTDYSPRMYEGEAILVDPDLKPLPGDEVVVKKVRAKKAVLFELVKTRGKNFTFNKLTEKKDRLVIPKDQIKFIHSITAVVRTNIADVY